MSEDQEVRHPIKPEKASEQATEYLGFMGGVPFDLGDGEVWTLPNPMLMPPEMKVRHLAHISFVTDELDTETKKVKHPITGEVEEVTRQLYPLRHKGKSVIEDELLCVALMGEDGDYERYVETGAKVDGKVLRGDLPKRYQRFLAAGGVPGQISLAWTMMQRQLEKRARADSKSS